MRTLIFRYLLLGIGIGGMILSAVLDFIRPGKIEIGMTQLAGFIVSTVVALAGLHKSTFPRAKAWAGILLLIYLAGILFMGLRPMTFKYDTMKAFLTASTLPMDDFIINIVGFIPFGYLILLYMFSGKRPGRAGGVFLKFGLALAVGIGTSLAIETVQFYIPGRTSSLYDLIANGAGTFIGVVYFALEEKLSGR
jgi:VanZ family protein